MLGGFVLLSVYLITGHLNKSAALANMYMCTSIPKMVAVPSYNCRNRDRGLGVGGRSGLSIRQG